MNKKLILFHLCVILVLLGGIFGVTFGITYPSIIYTNRFTEGNCTMINYTVSNYTFCEQICNTTIPNCTTLLNTNSSGICYNSSDNYDIYKRCYVDCYVYYLLTTLYSIAGINENIIIDCKNNQTCINQIMFNNYIRCYYDISSQEILLNHPKIYNWEFIVVIIILILLLGLYIIINLTIFKKHIFV